MGTLLGACMVGARLSVYEEILERVLGKTPRIEG